MDLTNPSTKSWSDYVSSVSSGIGHRAWWFARDPDPTNKRSGDFEGLEKSLELIGDLIQRNGPVHAIWGFSQGACFAGMLVALLGENSQMHPLRRYLPREQGTPAVGIFFSGFKARFEQYDSIYLPGIDVRTMHIMGMDDDAVSMKRSEELVAVCKSAEVLKHPGGHNIPKSDGDRERILQFLRHSSSNRERQSL